MLVLAQSAQNGVGRRAHTALQGQELLGDASLVHLLHEELSGQETNLVGHGVAVLEGTGLVRNVTLHDTGQLVLGNHHVGHADAVAYMLNGNGLAVRRVERLVHVVNELGVGVVERVKLQNHPLGQTGSRRRDATGSGQIDVILVAGILDVADLENGPVHGTVEAIAQLLCHVAQVQVVVGNLTQVHVLAEVGVRRVGGTIEECLCVGQVTVGALSCGGTREDGYFELTASLMLSNGQLRQFLGGCFGYTGRCEATHGDVVAVLDQCCSFGSG